MEAASQSALSPAATAKSIYAGRTRVLAPLVGGSDLSFRLLARKYGAQVTFTEMCVAEYYLESLKDPKIKHKQYASRSCQP
jgi:tRNA-dihydrouridine synthase